MPSPSIGAIPVFDLAWTKKSIPHARSSVYRQPDRNGNSHAVGPVYGEASTIQTTTYLTYQGDEKMYLQTVAALCGASHTITEVSSLGTEFDMDDVWIEAVTPRKSNACIGPGNTGWVVILEWIVYIPETW